MQELNHRNVSGFCSLVSGYTINGYEYECIVEYIQKKEKKLAIPISGLYAPETCFIDITQFGERKDNKEQFIQLRVSFTNTDGEKLVSTKSFKLPNGLYWKKPQQQY